MSTFLDNWLLRRAMSAPRGSKEYIQFADPAVEAICVANWSSDGIGVTFEDAAGVTDSQFGTTFKGNTQIVNFDELQYFTGVTSLPQDAFNGCTSLLRVTIPSNITRNIYGGFNGCSSLSEVTFLSPVNFVGQNSTFRSTAITRINLPSDSFESVASALTKTKINDTYNGNLRIFVDGTQVLDFEAASGTTTIQDSAMRGIVANTIILPDSVTLISPSAFFSLTIGSLVLLSTTPPTISDKYDVGGYFSRKYVPYSADHSILNAYKSANVWDKIPDYIFELNPDGTIPS